MNTTIGSLDEKESSIVRVLTQGSGIAPKSIDEIRTHLTQTDKASWTIILRQLTLLAPEKLREIWNAVDNVAGVQFTSQQLVHMLLGLSGGESLRRIENTEGDIVAVA